jgi:hypothetical protein
MARPLVASCSRSGPVSTVHKFYNRDSAARAIRGCTVGHIQREVEILSSRSLEWGKTRLVFIWKCKSRAKADLGAGQDDDNHFSRDT